ncbi:CheR family methyltransferase [Treponema brennaborense]|uniref:MCP methyltransferase, CheR-type n=1 Tax=Treponema brennaborense (strain DSM 12168 / CIP 105900 / DD5/3) TaxID=906968 RepID=F4LIF9_TREBD|nr:CheR family methyltransferase [Treponema brennaborense]AEE16200.1 MCP methyltransferase, CheR-type [Treponema brennaborense DSM 12168]
MEAVVENTELTAGSAENTADANKERIAAVDFKMVTFSLAGKDYAIDIMKVKEIAKAGHFTYVPNTLPFVLGVYNLRGDIIPIVDLRLFFNIEVPERSKEDLENMLIVTVDEQPFGVVVDVIDKVVGIQQSTIQPPHPLFGDINIKYIYGVVESNDRLYVLLDIDRIFGVRGVAHTDETKSEESKFAVVHPHEEPAAAEPGETKAVSAPPAKQSRAASPQPQAVAPAAVKDPFEADFLFVKDSLQKLKSFYVNDINEAWVKRRFAEWQKERGDAVQLTNVQDAEAFLAPFYSTDTASFWSRQYADAVYKTLPENGAKQIVVWNPGSGKGYEAYSLACLLAKRYPESRVKIYAQDIDLLSVSNAPLLTVPAKFAEDWYAPYVVRSVSGEYVFSAEIKDTVMFEYHDCMHANTMPPVDIIFSRDVVSFLAPGTQETLFEDFDEKLKGNGIIILGENETLANMSAWSEKMVGSVVIYGKQ